MAGQRYGVEVRRALPTDAAEIARLLGQGGIALTAEEAAVRLEAVRAHAHAAVLVTTGWNSLSGLVALAWAPMLQQGRPVARITAMLVDEDQRRNGIGRLLLKAASQAARSGGCDLLEIASQHPALEAFCRATGFETIGGVYERSLRRRAE
jgi:GNAT superfamily N-acetyltransferase